MYWGLLTLSDTILRNAKAAQPLLQNLTDRDDSAQMLCSIALGRQMPSVLLNLQTTLTGQLTCPTRPFSRLASNQAGMCLESMHHVPSHGCSQSPSMPSKV